MYYKIFNIPVCSFIFRTAKAIPDRRPARKTRHCSISAFDEIDRALADGEIVCIFPEGGLTHDGEIADLPARCRTHPRASCRYR